MSFIELKPDSTVRARDLWQVRARLFTASNKGRVARLEISLSPQVMHDNPVFLTQQWKLLVGTGDNHGKVQLLPLAGAPLALRTHKLYRGKKASSQVRGIFQSCPVPGVEGTVPSTDCTDVTITEMGHILCRLPPRIAMLVCGGPEDKPKAPMPVQEEPETPELVPNREADIEMTANGKRIYQALRREQAKRGENFTMTITNLAIKAEVPLGSMQLEVARLTQAKLVRKQGEQGRAPEWTVL